MATEILVPATTAAQSDPVALNDGQTATVFLTSTDPSLPANVGLVLQLQRAGGAWVDVLSLQAPDRATARVTGPTSFRVVRGAPGVRPVPIGAEYNISTASSGGGGGGAVTVADGASVTLGARADAPAASDTATASLMAFMKRLVGKIPGFGAAASAAALPVVLASDDAQIGTKTNAATALPTGGAGLIGWLSNIWVAITSLLNVNTLRAPLLARQLLVTNVSQNMALTAGTARVSIFARSCDLRFALSATANPSVTNTAPSVAGAAANAHFVAQG
ncbi:MAG: hypothetical protein REI11_19685, partial [Patulibacter sp.]|nr:hypothetical protein [Patulibacter sp.]